ncbi:TolC family protein [Alloacidobacterium sp.]|uniref:TolC family protein n=1 Tax=Alloacidobacterium sp. TaxID=2951999 RepID=UPI002D526C34|nr:TolC family protein [Alloacidobacterium sp.]HYK36512.1 TolC family protein [Alloacidobacterium sp.]
MKLRATAAIAMTLVSTAPSWALGPQTTQQQTQPPATAQAAIQTNSQSNTDPALQGLPPEPAPNYTQPLYMRPTSHDYSKPRGYWPNLFKPYLPMTAEAPRFTNAVHLPDLVKDGKIYLSLSDAVLLALENNYDIAIQRYNLDVADTDILRTKAGGLFLGVPTGLVTGTLGGSTSTVAASTGGGPGGTTTSAGGAASGAAGITGTTNGGGPLPEQMDPTVTGTIQLERTTSPQTTTFITGTNTLNQNQNIYNFTYNQGFVTGTALNFTFDNSYTTSNSQRSNYSPALQSTFKLQLTQHLLNGCCIGINDRFMIEAKNNRRIADSAFRQQLLFTINQVENIYWGLVSAYEDYQAKTRALAQSTQLASDNRKQLAIGTLAPLDVVNADSQVASDKQALISSQSTLEYQQLIMKQALIRNLDDPALINAPVIPTDRVSLLETPEEKMPVDDLVRQADANSPQIEQAILAIKNNQITLKGVKNGLLPTLDVYGFYGGSGIAGSQSPFLNCSPIFGGPFVPCPPGIVPPLGGYGSTLQNTFNGSGPDKGVGFSLNVPIRNRINQAEQARAMLEFRQSQMRLEQLYVQTRMNVINGQFALTNDRAAVQSSLAAREYAYQSLDAEQKKYHLGASTTANVLQQERNLATAENNVISATAKYAVDRAGLAETLSNTLDRYGISVADAATGTVTQKPTIPGLEPAKQLPEVVLPAQPQNLQQQQQQPVPEPQNQPHTQMPAQPTQPQSQQPQSQPQL